MDSPMLDADEYQVPFPALPIEINVYILLHLDLQTLVRTRRVNRAFASFSKEYLGPGLLCKLKYIYGGDEGSSLINRPNKDLIRFHLRTHDYQHIKFPNLPVMTEHTCVFWRNSLYLFGGFVRAEGELTSAYSDHIFRIPLGNEKGSERLKLGAFGPKTRSAHSAVVHQDTMYVYGGWIGRNSDTHNDFWAFHFKEQKWELLPNPIVPAMRAHASCVYKDSIYIFGGFCEAMQPSEFNKLYRFDIPTKTWSIVSVKGTPPEGRSRCSMVSAQGGLYVFGGWNRVKSFADLHQFDIATSTWYQIKLRNDDLIKGGIQHHSCIVYHNFLLIYGGTVNNRLNENLYVMPI